MKYFVVLKKECVYLKCLLKVYLHFLISIMSFLFFMFFVKLQWFSSSSRDFFQALFCDLLVSAAFWWALSSCLLCVASLCVWAGGSCIPEYREMAVLLYTWLCCLSGSVVVRVSFSAHRRFLFHSVDPRCRPGCGSPRGGLGTQLQVPFSPYVGGAVVWTSWLPGHVACQLVSRLGC